MNFLSDIFPTANSVTNPMDTVTGPAGQRVCTIASTSGMYTVDLNGNEILRLLAAAAEDVYTFDGAQTAGRLSLGHQQHEFFGSGNGLQFGIYIVNGGEWDGKKICAFRGTDSFGKVEDIDLVISNSSGSIREAIHWGCENLRNNNADFVCGHSLAGLIAECVCAHTGISGAAFNAPGPWTSAPNSLVDGKNYNYVPFEIHLTRNDVVSHTSVVGVTGTDASHIGTPKWHIHDGGHSMAALRADIGNL